MTSPSAINTVSDSSLSTSVAATSSYVPRLNIDEVNMFVLRAQRRNDTTQEQSQQQGQEQSQQQGQEQQRHTADLEDKMAQISPNTEATDGWAQTVYSDLPEFPWHVASTSSSALVCSHEQSQQVGTDLDDHPGSRSGPSGIAGQTLEQAPTQYAAQPRSQAQPSERAHYSALSQSSYSSQPSVRLQSSHRWADLSQSRFPARTQPMGPGPLPSPRFIYEPRDCPGPGLSRRADIRALPRGSTRYLGPSSEAHPAGLRITYHASQATPVARIKACLAAADSEYKDLMKFVNERPGSGHGPHPLGVPDLAVEAWREQTLYSLESQVVPLLAGMSRRVSEQIGHAVSRGTFGEFGHDRRPWHGSVPCRGDYAGHGRPGEFGDRARVLAGGQNGQNGRSEKGGQFSHGGQLDQTGHTVHANRVDPSTQFMSQQRSQPSHQTPQNRVSWRQHSHAGSRGGHLSEEESDEGCENGDGGWSGRSSPSDMGFGGSWPRARKTGLAPSVNQFRSL